MSIIELPAYICSINGTFPERLIPDGLTPSIADRIPATQRVVLVQIFPVLILFYVLAVLVQLPGTRVLRLSILPAIGMLAWRVCTRYDFDGSDEPGYNWTSMTVCVRPFQYLV
jgi:hypothetical protein